MSRLIAVVDDSEVVLEWTREHLCGAGFNVVTHNSAFGIASFITETQPDLVLLDINMPGIQGDFLCKMIKRGDWEREVRVVLYSSMSEDALATASDQCGADGYIKKTDYPADLIGEVKLNLAVLGG